ncbi:MAG: molybdopterin-dependent oxidoreductase [Acidobacteriota bacterium]|nr:molybdopterin-dependent oxidoreductase [Acidobacteriota bacterium]
MNDRGFSEESYRRAAPSRRGFLGGVLGVGGALLLDPRVALALESVSDTSFPAPNGTLIGRVPFQLEPDAPLGERIHDGLDTRLYTDHARVVPDRLLTPSNEFFIRTGKPDGLETPQPWRLRVDGWVGKEQDLDAARLAGRSSDRGIHVMECAGNSRWVRFGLLSAASWTGVPLSTLFEEAGPLPEAASVRVSGFDTHSAASTNSSGGCSWVFPLKDLESTGAFLATAMNGAPLSPDHGHPVRLVVPGWYGCCCVKWVERVEVVDDRQPATNQMIEFASRTHQSGTPKMAAEYRPATVDLAAMATRVEAWQVEDRRVYRISGLSWGGDDSRLGGDRLAIRFAPNGPYRRVTHQPRRALSGSWGLWSHDWRPERPGRYLIQLRVDDPMISTRRLDAGYYVRAVEIKGD